MSIIQPPPFVAHTIELGPEDGKIAKVSVYPGRAEVTRVYNLLLQPGVNQVQITGLPATLDRDSLRVEGRGPATIQDVGITASTPVDEATSTLSQLKLERERIRKAQTRCQDATSVIQRLFRHMNIEKMDVGQIAPLMATYESESAKLDEREIELGEQLKGVKTKITEELNRRGARLPSSLSANIGVFADQEGEAEIVLIYAVHGATWEARYDIRVNMQSKDRPVRLVYKAAISQSSGESWENVALTLETITPTFGLDLPTLEPLHLSGRPPSPMAGAARRKRSASPHYSPTSPRYSPTSPRRHGVVHVRHSRSRSRSPRRRHRERARARSRSYSPRSPSLSRSPPRRRGHSRSRSPSPPRIMPHATIAVTNFGGLSTSYDVPGYISIPSDGEAHNVTIAELDLSAQFSWISIPKVDTKVHLQALVNNDSEYTLLPGVASIYVDGSFTSKTDFASVNPHEDFTCGLGLDPAVRLVYHPLVQKSSQSGFMNKATITRYTRRITVNNNKPIPINNLTVVDRIPVSVDAQIIVKLLTPPLPLPPSRSDKVPIPPQEVKPMIKMGEGVLATWEAPGADAGKDGKLNWLCSIPPQGKVTVSLVWEETSPDMVRVRSFFRQ